jgi:ribose transport system substrate-binding protein
VATADYSSFLQGCFAAMSAIRTLRKLPVSENLVFPATLIDKDNAAKFDIPTEGRACPAWETVGK